MDIKRKNHRSAAVGQRNIDGVFNNQDIKPPKSGIFKSKPTTSALPPTSGLIGDFRRQEGFYPTQQNVINSLPQSSNSATPSTILGRQAIAESQKLHLPPFSDKKTRPKRRWSLKKRLWVSSAAIIASLLLIIGFLFLKGYIKLRKVLPGGTNGAPALQQNVDPTKLKGEGDGRINILMLGKGGDGHTAPDLTDTILIASLDPVQNEAALLSVPRDLYVKNSFGGSVKINQIYVDAKNNILNGPSIVNKNDAAEKAGFKAIEEVLSQTMGIPIHYHIMVDFQAFREAIDTVGGIDLDVKTALYEVQWLEDQRRSFVLNVKPGKEHFDGVRALAYARSRQTSPRGDFDRTERQRAILLALKDKVLSLGTYSNPIRISQLIDAFGNHVQTNLSTSEMKRLYEIGKLIDASKVISLGLADPPNAYVKTANISGLSVVIPRKGTYDYLEIQNYVRNALKDGFIKNENASIAILNGTTTPGLATRKAELLRSFGYNVTVVADAPTKDYSQTMLIDLTNGSKKYTKHYLQQRLGVIARNDLPSSSITAGSADFVIILGQNEAVTQ